jgi:hypothetical protein
MQRKHWYIILGSLAVAALCCCLAVVGAAGYIFYLGQSAEAAHDSGTGLGPVGEVGPPPDFNLTRPTLAELDTVERLAVTSIPVRDLAELAHRLNGMPESITQLEIDPAPAYDLGDSLGFWVTDVRDNSYFKSTATLAYETPHAYWWVEEGYELDPGDLERSARRFEEVTYPTNRRYFGSEWFPGVDGDQHVYIFLGNVPGVGGYFSGPDEYPAQISGHSNQHEMFYINLDNAGPGSDYFDGVLAHEYQHMIHWSEDRNEDTWVNEGLSELAAQVNGYDVGSTDTLFSLNPDTQLNTWPDLEYAGPNYGASYLFLSYFLERYGEDSVRKLVAEQANGPAGFEAVLASVDPSTCCFEGLFADWVVANYLDKPRLADGRYGYSSLTVDKPTHAASHRTFPVQEEASVHQFAADYILLEGKGDVTIEFTGSLKVPLVGGAPVSGEYQWWSNRGDDGDATLTREFDLSGLEQATLQAWMWYDLETDFDYAYVEVSPDNGESWDLLANDDTTTSNPTGSSYGAALNGVSGGGERPAWVEEVFDLSPYVGGPILLRFEVIYDDALNYPGLLVDEISIPELGFRDDVEGGDNGWVAEGWLRVTGDVPQEYIVQLIAIGNDTGVRRMELGDLNKGTLTITGLGRDVDRAVLVVSGATRVTTARAPYQYRVTED